MGKPSSKTDSQGRKKAQCRICNLWYHRVDLHVEKKHNMTPVEYQKKFPGAPVLSKTAQEDIEEDDGEDEIEDDPSILRFGCAKLNVRDGGELSDYDKKFIPKHDEDWILGSEEERNLEALALGMEEDENVLIVGPPGVGKTTLAKELAALVNHPLQRIPFNGELRTSDLLGRDQLVVDEKTGQSITVPSKGPFVDCAENGHWTLLDEFDSGPSHVMFKLHSALEAHERYLPGVDFNKNFRVIATANTMGYGDDTGLYSGTAPQNEALLDRFGIVIQAKYPKKADEVEMLKKKSGVKEADATKMVEIANQVRDAQKNDTTMVSLSPRRLIMWGKRLSRMGDARRAAEICILNKVPPDDRKYLDGVIQRYFGGKL